MITQIICGNPSPILEMQKTLSVISMNLTPLPHAHSPLIQQTFFCFSKSGWSHLLKSTHAAFLLITWKSIFRRGVVLQSHLGPTSGTTHLMDLVNFLSFILSYLIFQTSNREEILYENSLISHPLSFHEHVFASWQTLFY